MKNIKSGNTKKTTVFLTAVISSLTIQLLAQSSYPVFEDLTVEIHKTQLANTAVVE